MDTFVAEARSITPDDQPENILQVLRKINELLDDSPKAVELVRSLRDCAIFPVDRKGARQLTLLSLADEWFVADNQRLARMFQGKIPLLVWQIEDIRQLENLVRTLEVDQHFLSQNVRRNARIVGRSPRLSEDQTNMLREKARLVAW